MLYIYHKGLNAKLDCKYKIFVTTPIKDSFFFAYFMNFSDATIVSWTLVSPDFTLTLQFIVFLTIQQLSRCIT